MCTDGPETGMRTLTNCPFCGGAIVGKFSGLEDRLETTTETFSVGECVACRVGMLNPRPVGDLSRFYPSNYLSGEPQTGQAFNRGFDLEKWYRYNQYRYDFKLLQRASGVELKSASSYIDIGCGSGERVTFAADQGCQRASGVDKFDFAKSSSKASVSLINSEILDFKPSEKFQVGSLFHVLEHLENPEEVLVHIRENILAEGGKLVVQVPNYGSLERRVFGGRWYSLDVPRHLWQFNVEVLVKLLRRSGYTVQASYQLNAPLHPVSILPSLNRELDIQRIWVKRARGGTQTTFMTIMWAGLTIMAVPVVVVQNMLRRSSMLTVVATRDL